MSLFFVRWQNIIQSKIWYLIFNKSSCTHTDAHTNNIDNDKNRILLLRTKIFFLLLHRKQYISNGLCVYTQRIKSTKPFDTNLCPAEYSFIIAAAYY